MLFLSFYMMSFIIVISSNDWFLIWMGLEINMLSFIFMIYSRESMINIESCIKYFFIQGFGSSLLMSSFYLNKFDYLYSSSIILSYKMGGGPFFYWFPSMCMSISWISCFVLMTFQKIIPMMLMSFFMSWMLWVIIFISLIVGVFGSFNQVNLKSLMAFSSIHHMGWMLTCMLAEESAWVIYFLSYLLVVIPLFLYFWKKELSSIISLMKLKSKFLFIMMIMSMGGMPPFLGFFLKWMSFYYILMMDYFMLIFMVIMSSSMLYVYLRFIYKMIMMFSEKMSWIYKEQFLLFSFSFDFLVLLGLMGSSILGIFFII